MRTLLAVAALVLLVAPGCGDDTTKPANGDMAVTLDMATAGGGGDMTKLNCAQLLACAQACTSQACVVTCGANATTDAQTKAVALSACVYGACGPLDGGTNACTSPADTSAGCRACQGGAIQGACMAKYAACTSS